MAPAFYLPTWENFAMLYTSLELARNLLKWSVLGTSTLVRDIIQSYATL